jgi:hypothetical protein
MRCTGNPPQSASSEALRRLLLGRSAMAQQLQRQFSRSLLWRLGASQRLPSIRTAFELAKISRGRISMHGWLEPPMRWRG